ncbi:MAG: TIGR02217 family protein [Rhodobacteraceae bacterium]|jgi:uncharacterized protein (TIGR02217 family)|uniref:TIGR02217 family protein n=1 Tax=Salipiger profundus TaxID=1229727 RepID=A0A1U7CZU3_9RHOB|nr:MULTISPECIES: DUF2460 domain-containing protein [Salipiger]APX21411.1 TIGR02217 family protein [Salipiger profundus]MAB08821.1 TIGR02217 family protein [Paracoccaceae bacterium]GGA02557.1 glycoside hydrolase family 24 [Salipiger profundus]SFC21946.1 TIGR02217 family protein [Salipiger profundus]
MSFHEVRFPADLSFGALGGPERRTDVVELTSGHEERNTPWAHSRRRYDAGLGLRDLDDIENLLAFFEARRGQLHGFRWKDWADHKSCRPGGTISATDQVIARGDGATRSFQLVKVYRSGGESYARPITKPVAGTVLAAVQDVEMREGVHFDIDTATGILTFAEPPLADVEITAGYEFDVPVRFDTDRINVSVASFQAGQAPDVPVVEVRV